MHLSPGGVQARGRRRVTPTSALQTPGTSWTFYGPAVRGRACGACKACCTLVPVHLAPEDYKPANQRCRHVCSKGCRVYDDRPEPCQAWSCAWLIQERTEGLRRPDQAGYVIDPLLDEIQVNGAPVSAVQVWLDPARPQAHTDPALRAWLEALGMPAIVRRSEWTGFVLLPPALTGGGWIEAETAINERIGCYAQLTDAERQAARAA